MTTAHGMTRESVPSSIDEVAMPTPEALAQFSGQRNLWEVKLASNPDPRYPVVIMDEDPETQGLREAFEFLASATLNSFEAVVLHAGDFVEHVCHMGSTKSGPGLTA